ncbi:MAG: TonB-dependent siderophore receptor, partial [Rhizomicrobium sp.]
PSSIKHTSQEHWFAAPSVKLALGSDTDLTLMAYYQRDDGGADFQMLPYLGTVEKTIYGYIDNHTFLGEPSWNKFDRSEATLSWVLEHRFNAHWSLSQSARYAHVDNDYRTTQANKDTLTNDRILPRRAVAGVGGAETLTADTRLAGQFSTGALEHSVLFGFDEMRSQWDRARQQSTLSATSIAIDVFNPVYHDYDFAPTLKPTLSETGTQNQSGLYAQDQIAYGHWRLLISGRQDWFLNKTTDRLDGTLTKVESSAFTERAGLLYLFDSGLSPYASFANSFEPASYTATDNYNGKAFSPVTGQQFEVGFKYQPKTIDGMITVSAYELKQQHIATTDPDDSHDCGSGAGSCYVETGEMRVRGIELEGRITPVQGFSIIGALTHMDSAITKATDGTQGHDMIRVPQWLSSIWLDYSFGPGWFNGLSLAGGSRYVGRSFGDTANTLDVPSYALWDGALRYDLTKLGLAVAGTRKLQLAVNANNIGDKRYVASCTSSTVCYYGSGRMVQISLQLGW